MKKIPAVLRWIGVASLFAALWASPLTVPPAGATVMVRRVKVGGISGGVCGDIWANACDLQYALTTAAQPGGEVWVQAGRIPQQLEATAPSVLS